MEEIKIKDKFSSDDLEHDIHKKICRERFFAIIQDSKFDLNLLYGNIKSAHELVGKFNYLLKQIKTNLSINIFEMILFLEEGGHKFRKTISILDEQNKETLKNEMSYKYKKPIEINVIDDILINN